MASSKCVTELLTLNASLHGNHLPADEASAKLVIAVWMAALAPFSDADVEAEAIPLFAKSKFSLKPADLAVPLAKKALLIDPWEVAFNDVSERIHAQCGKLRDMSDGPAKRIGMLMRNTILNADPESMGTIRAQFRDAYNLACEEYIDTERQEGGLLEAPPSPRLLGVDPNPQAALPHRKTASATRREMDSPGQDPATGAREAEGSLTS